MEFQIKELRKKDHKKAIQFAIQGMHFEWFLKNKFLLNLYGRYFWYSSLLRSTQSIAIYHNDDLVGVLLADFKDEPKKHISTFKKHYIQTFDTLFNTFSEKGASLYEQTNLEMYKKQFKDTAPDGELIFLASNPKLKNKGIGSSLIYELKKIEQGKTIFLYTDDSCDYKFYDHMGFGRVEQRDIIMEIMDKKVDLTCFLYTKKI